MEAINNLWWQALDVVDRNTNLERTKDKPTALRPLIHQAANVLNDSYGAYRRLREYEIFNKFEKLRREQKEKFSETVAYVEEKPEVLGLSSALIGATTGIRGGPRKIIRRGVVGMDYLSQHEVTMRYQGGVVGFALLFQLLR